MPAVVQSNRRRKANATAEVPVYTSRFPADIWFGLEPTWLNVAGPDAYSRSAQAWAQAWCRPGRARRAREKQGEGLTERPIIGLPSVAVRTASWVTAQTGFMGDGGRSLTSTILRALPIRSAS